MIIKNFFYGEPIFAILQFMVIQLPYKICANSFNMVCITIKMLDKKTLGMVMQYHILKKK